MSRIKELIIGTIVFLALMFSGIGLLEVILRNTDWLDQTERPSPTYVPRKFKNMHQVINEKGFIDNEGFRNVRRTSSLLNDLKKDKGCKVVVLGDSFVWGSGLLPSDRWTSLLERKISCKVYPFGKNGWTSLEEFAYYQKNLIDIKFDYLIIGLVSNDPHPRGTFGGFDYSRDIVIQKYWNVKNFFGLSDAIEVTLKENFLVYDYVDQILGNVVNSMVKSTGSMNEGGIVSYGYSKWEDRLYESDVFSIWMGAVGEFNRISKHKYGFLITPTDVSSRSIVMNEKMTSALDFYRINYFNTLPTLTPLINGDIRPRSMWANLADGHPGILQSNVYAEGALRLLKKLGYK